jgi:signal transduction histidine kinase
MLNKKVIINHLLELIIFLLNTVVLTYGLFKILLSNPSSQNNLVYSIFIILLGIIGGTIIPGASVIFKKMLSKFEYAEANTISINEFKASLPFIITSIIFSVLISNLFIAIMMDIKSLTEFQNVRKSLGFEIPLIINLAFLSIEISPFFVRLLLNNKDQVIFEQTKEISKINEQLKQSYETQLRIVNSIQHELGNKLPIVKFSVSDLETHLIKLSQKGEINLNAKIREPFEGESIENIASIQSLVDVIDTELQNSVLIVQNMRAIVQTDSGRTKKNPTIINDFIKDDLKYRQGQFTKNIRIEIEGENVAINLDQAQFKVLLDNIYSNALRHSFIDIEKQYNFKILISKTKGSVELIFMNNGEPFSENINTTSYTELNEFYGDTGNTGIGGYLIGQVVRNHNGELSIEKRFEFQNFNTFITIKLPL